MKENISAISTARGVGGVAIIRISGENLLKTVEKMFRPVGKTKVEDFIPYMMYPGEILCEDITDFGLCVYFKGPKSYTGEDMVEFHCHGGVAVSEAVLKQTFRLGVKPATNGEFTKRAFLNGKLSLSSAEGLIDMINSESSAEVKAGYYLYREKLTDKIISLQDKITFALAEIDADIDYPEEGLNSFATEKTDECLNEVCAELKKLISSYGSGRKIKDGVKVAICGKPNTGKSSILNALLSYDKAIVSSIAGTTRDVVEGTIIINGIKFNLFDTAGIRRSSDEIENLGIDRSKRIIDECDVAMFVVDGSKDLEKEDKEVLSAIQNVPKITVFNKSDLGSSCKDVTCDVSISAKNGEGIEELKNLLFKKGVGNISVESDFLTEERHFIALNKAYDKLSLAKTNLTILPLDLVALDIKSAWSSLGEISGLTADERIIDEIFSKFCVGK